MGPLAVMLYKALDYRLEESEERELDPALSSLIEVMLEMEDNTYSISELVCCSTVLCTYCVLQFRMK